MINKVSVLVTGSSGRLGRAAVAELKRCGHPVRGFDLSPNPQLEDTVLGSLNDPSALAQAMHGIECVIHLAATPDDDDFLEHLLPNNLVGVYHTLEQARRAGVRRVVLASSGQVNWWQQLRGPHPIHPLDPVSPRSWYAATKLFLESIGRSLSEIDGISVITARLGWCPRTPEQVAEIAASHHAQNLYLSPGDAGRFFACCVQAPDTVRHAVVFAASRPLGNPIFNLSVTERLLGFAPQDAWPVGCSDF